jgi:hypothetical protein
LTAAQVDRNWKRASRPIFNSWGAEAASGPVKAQKL